MQAHAKAGTSIKTLNVSSYKKLKIIGKREITGLWKIDTLVAIQNTAIMWLLQ